MSNKIKYGWLGLLVAAFVALNATASPEAFAQTAYGDTDNGSVESVTSDDGDDGDSDGDEWEWGGSRDREWLENRSTVRGDGWWRDGWDDDDSDGDDDDTDEPDEWTHWTNLRLIDADSPDAVDDGDGANGDFWVTYDEDGDVADYRLDIWNVDNVTDAHFHCEPNAAVVAMIFHSHMSVDADGTVIRSSLDSTDIEEDAVCETRIDGLSDLLEGIENGDVFVNVHSVNSPTGILRGDFEDATTTDEDDEDDSDGDEDDEWQDWEDSRGYMHYDGWIDWDDDGVEDDNESDGYAETWEDDDGYMHYAEWTDWNDNGTADDDEWHDGRNDANNPNDDDDDDDTSNQL